MCVIIPHGHDDTSARSSFIPAKCIADTLLCTFTLALLKDCAFAVQRLHTLVVRCLLSLVDVINSLFT